MDTVWLVGHLDDLALRTLQHLGLAALGVGVGFVLSIGLSILAVRVRPTLGPILALSGILYTIPSLAIFAALVSVTGLSLLTAEVPLVLYTLLIFIRNIVAGLDSVPADVIERLSAMPEFVRAYEPDGMKPNDFVTFGVTQRTLCQFAEVGWKLMESFK